MFLLLSCLTVALPDFVTSKFGKPGVDEVVIEFHDGFEVLKHNLPKQKTKLISELKLTPFINDTDYPWPGHDLKCNWTYLLQETRLIHKAYHNNSIRPDQNYRHPVADKQFYTTYDALDKAERVEVKFTLTPKYNRHFGRVFIPPGEIATFKIHSGALNKVGVTYNKFMSGIWTLDNGKPKYSKRLDNPRIDNIRLTKEVNTLACPWCYHQF